eukprot:1634368-Rhodomonas_salina.2
MGIGLGFGDDRHDQPDDLDKIHSQTVCEMDEQIHRSSLCMNHAYCSVMELLQDDYLLDMEEHSAFLHRTASFSQILSFSSLLSMEYRHLRAPLRFQLVLLDDLFLLLLLASTQSFRSWTLQASYNQCVFEAWSTERKQQQDLFALKNQQFHLAGDIIDSGGSAPLVPCPTDKAWKALKRVLRYLVTTKDRGISWTRSPTSLGKTGHERGELYAYVDAAYADCSITRKSTMGYVLMLNAGEIAWRSKREPIVALSTAEAEYMAACYAAQEVVS